MIRVRWPFCEEKTCRSDNRTNREQRKRDFEIAENVCEDSCDNGTARHAEHDDER
jgi:hypothetical protein